MQHAEARLAAQRRPVALDVSPLLPLLNPTSCFNDTASVTEVLMHQLPDDTLFIADENVTAGHEYDMRTLFDEIEKSEIEGEPAEETMQTERGAKLLIDLSSEKTDKLLDDFDSKLIGQAPFKKALRKQVGAFRLFNSIGEQPIPSMLLLGPSDVGKTETARILSDLLAPSQPLPKINFGNYSSKDSLNSLIGSPRSHIGSEFANSGMDELLEAFGIRRPLSRKGNPYDNAVIESTNKILKRKLIYRRAFASLDQLRRELNSYVRWYNEERIHSTLGYMSSVEFRRQDCPCENCLIRCSKSRCPPARDW